MFRCFFWRREKGDGGWRRGKGGRGFWVRGGGVESVLAVLFFSVVVSKRSVLFRFFFSGGCVF